MANATSSGRTAACNPYSPSFETVTTVEPCPVHPGLVAHPLLTPGVQVQILSIVDATGSASIGDIVEELSGHEDPVGATFALIAAGALAVRTPGIIDANSIVIRCDGGGTMGCVDPITPVPSTLAAGDGVPDAHDDTLAIGIVDSLPGGLRMVATNELQPQVIVGSGAQRSDFGRAGCLQRPGVYILLRGHEAYVGYGSAVGPRIAAGRQMPSGTPDRIIAITDAQNGLTEDDGKALERILWARVAADADFTLVNAVPDGVAIDPARYDLLSLLAGQVALALRRAGLLFLGGSTRETIAGPRTEPGRLGTPRRIDDLPDGRVMELSFHGLIALAAERTDGSWLLLRGSDVRVETVASANCSAAYQRAAWVHAGLLEPAADGSCYVLMRDLVFGSGSAAGHFVAGSKGFGRAAWVPIDEDADLPEPVL